jgi:periplasmic divalent cation tolerance protein
VDRPVVALVTAPVGDADRIADAIVEGGHAACVNVVPLVRSVYRWKGAVTRDDEALLIVKTVAARIDTLRPLLDEIHPYDVFELVTLDVTAGNAPYLDWIVAETAPRAGGR